MAQTVAEAGERALIARIRARLPQPPAFVVVGIGDDAAVVEPGRRMLEVLTTDSQVEGVHFDLAFSAPSDVGHKALAVNLSDLAAMGASPRVALLSLVLPAALPVASLEGLLDGMVTLASESRISIVGGNIARSPGPLIVDVTVTGLVHPRGMLLRAGGRAGDDLYVTGMLGGAALGLRALRAAAGGHEAASATEEAARQRHRKPQPRLRFGTALGRNRAARACVDLSDGLADGVRQIADASGLGAIIDADSVPLYPGSTLADALAGGEDYELLFAVPPRWRGRLRHVQSRVTDLPVARIGKLTADRDIVITRSDGRREMLPEGFAHFA